MYNKIEEVLEGQMRLIEPIINNGILFNIRNMAEKEYDQLMNVRQKLQHNKNDDVAFNNVIVENSSLIIGAFSSVYSKLGDDSRTLPSEKLRSCAIDEMDAIMEVWNKLPSKNK